MIDLTDVTFIIPVRVESPDRRANALLTLNYLCKHLKTNITILEHDTTPKIPDILKDVDRGETVINYHFLENKIGNEIFHRTKFLNIMLCMTVTPIVVNYDVDILLQPNVYLKCRDLIKNGQDLVYPYFWGNSQHQVFYTGRDKLINNYNIGSLIQSDSNVTRSEYGHCQFFNTKSFIVDGMVNERFISYAPEDQERGYRFKQLGYKVMWSVDFVYHIEHTRGINSSTSNPMMEQNNKLFDYIKTLTVTELREYYNNIDYVNKYSPTIK